MKTRAGRALQAAIRKWNNSANWDWTRVVDDTISVTTTTATYALPYNIKSIYDVRLDDRPLFYADRRLYDRVSTQNPGYTTHYDLFRRGTQGVIELLPQPTVTGTLYTKYYRLLTQPCTVSISCTATLNSNTLTCSSVNGITIGSTVVMNEAFAAATVVKSIDSPTTFSTVASATTATAAGAAIGGDTQLLDVPGQYIDGVLAMATHQFLANKVGGADRSRLEYWYTEAQADLDRAMRENMNVPDEDLVFLPAHVSDRMADVVDPNIRDWM